MKEETLIKRAMTLLGQRKSKAKSAAARKNGAKGGRPKKVIPEPVEVA